MPAPRQINQKLVVAIVYVSAMILNSLDSTIINVALSTLAREFDVSPASIESVVPMPAPPVMIRIIEGLGGKLVEGVRRREDAY